MTVEERRLLQALANCRLPHSLPHKGLCVIMLKAVAKSGRYRLTGEQRATLWHLGHQYRARLPSETQALLVSVRKEGESLESVVILCEAPALEVLYVDIEEPLPV